MKSLKNMPRVISDSEKIACLQRDMIMLKQQIASMTSKNAQVSNENIALKSAVQDLKDKFYCLELILAHKSESQALKSLEDRNDSLRQNVEASFVSFTNDVKSILLNLENLNRKCVDNTYNNLVNKDCVDTLHSSLESLRKEAFSSFSQALSDFRKQIESKIAALPVPKVPLEKDEIEKMIAEAIVPAMQNVKKAMDWASEAKMDLGLFKRKIEKQVTY